MKNSDFLNKLKKEDKLAIVECSEETSLSYEKKGLECREVAKLAYEHGYFESAVTQSYYSMYNNVLSLFFKCGIKCENHSATAIILIDIFKQDDLYTIFLKAKGERIDKQYYTASSKDNSATKESAKEMIQIALRFTPRIISFKNSLKLQEIDNIKKNFEII